MAIQVREAIVGTVNDTFIPLWTKQHGVDTVLVRFAQTACADVFTPDGDAGCIDRLNTFTRPGQHLFGKGQCAFLTGRSIPDGGKWYPIEGLVIARDHTVHCLQHRVWNEYADRGEKQKLEELGG
jgi:hypothetical protein